MEDFITYIWKHKLTGRRLRTATGETVEILDYGYADKSDAKRFKSCRIMVDGRPLCGEITMTGNGACHTYKKEAVDATESVLFTAYIEDPITQNENKGVCTELFLHFPKMLAEEFCSAAERKERLQCHSCIAELPALQLHSIMERLLMERLEEKAAVARRFLEGCDGKWEEAFMKLVMRSFGFGIQSAAFEEWAELVDMTAIAKHRNNTVQVEAILFGQAGLLEEESIPYYYIESAKSSAYYNELVREYRFLEKKFALKRVKHTIWGYGNSTPHIRIARIASIIGQGKLTLSGVCNAETLTGLYGMLEAPLYGYWHNHTCFGGTETLGNGNLSQRHADIITINAIVPILFVYGKHNRDERLCGKAEDFLHWIKGEENSITRRWKAEGAAVECAADSQALIQLNKRYCTKNNCMECGFAYFYIKQRLQDYR
ncbi:MAG: DUF2851 family protein [Bacteroidaceae bacterium]|nr:DUF2851 family protein [Bacteroidaceae bacterium]